MKDLMIHVEKIVRPVRALQSRKLRMRRELLTHLQSAFDEERARGVEPQAAAELAMQRLGLPADLTVSLQKTVPWIERVLFAKFHLPQSFDRLEACSNRMYGLEHPLTMAHMAFLMFAAIVPSYAAILLALLVMSPQAILAAQFERWAAVVTLDVFVMVIILVVIFACARLLVIVSSDTLRLQSKHAARLAAILVASPLVVVLATVLLAGNRAPAIAEIGRGLILGAALVGSVFPVGRLIGRLRRPYDAWLALDLAA